MSAIEAAWAEQTGSNHKAWLDGWREATRWTRSQSRETCCAARLGQLGNHRAYARGFVAGIKEGGA